MSQSQHTLNALFEPQSIAVVGASHTPGKLGHDVFANILAGGYKGRAFPVNPKGGTILDVPVAMSIAEVDAVVDCAVIVVPAAAVPQVVTECGEAGVRVVVIVSAGFRETGAAGVQLEQEVLEVAKKYGIRIVGPNCIGVLNLQQQLNASFAGSTPKAGSVAFISQSGAVAIAAMDYLRSRNVGCSIVASMGNKLDVDDADVLEYCAQDKNTRVIACYTENIANGNRFLSVASRLSNEKPIIALMPGRSAKAHQAMGSHTGALATDSAITDSALARAGVRHVETLLEFFDSINILDRYGVLPGSRIAIITNAGGPGILAVDAAAQTTLELPTPSSSLQKILQAELPASASVQNPIDVIGDAPPERFAHALSAVAHSEEFDAILCIATPQTMTRPAEVAAHIAQTVATTQKPIVACFIGGGEVVTAIEACAAAGIPAVATPEAGIRALAVAAPREAVMPYTAPQAIAPQQEEQLSQIEQRIADAMASGAFQLPTVDAEALLAAYNLPVVRSALVSNTDQLQEHGVVAPDGSVTPYPVVMKIFSQEVIHKAAGGFVQLNIETAEQALRTMERMRTSLELTGATFEGVIVQPFLSFRSSKELFFGMKRDPAFGPVIVFGEGGSHVEQAGRVQCILPEADVQGMRGQLLHMPVFTEQSARTQEAILQCVDVLTTIALDQPDIQEIDMNPYVLDMDTDTGYSIDTRMMFHSATMPADAHGHA